MMMRERHVARNVAPRSRNRSTRHEETRRRTGARSRPPAPTDAPQSRWERFDAHVLDGWRGWALVAVFGVCAAVFVVLKAPLFAIDEVQMSGNARTSDGAILAALDLEPGIPLATWDSDPAMAAIAELPWVDQVRVTKSYPSTVRVVIRERAVSASVGSAIRQEWLIVDDGGHVLERRLTPAAGTRMILAPPDVIDNGSVGSPANGIQSALVASENLPLQLDPWVDHWSVSRDGAVTIGLTGGASASLGHSTDHRTQFVSLASILDGGTSLVCIDDIDLGVADTPVVSRDSSCLIAAEALS